MSVYNDVRILIQRKDYEDLREKVKNQGWGEYHLMKFDQATIKPVKTYFEGYDNFIMLCWNYVKWDLPTDELVQMIVEYIDMLIRNNIPCRYMCLSELGTIDERKGVGNDDPNLIPFIEGAMWVHSEIKSPEYYF